MDTCKFETCTRVVYSVTTGYCRSHNSQLKRGGELKPLRGEVVICHHEGCPYRAATKGYCNRHYHQFLYSGVTSGPGSPECEVVNCQRASVSGGLCQRHYVNGRDWIIDGSVVPCSVRGCDKSGSRGLCRWHKERARKFGLTNAQLVELTNVEGCECCGKKGVTLDIHHDHRCCDISGSCGGCVIAMLCSACNRAAGLVGDNPELLRKLADVVAKPPRFPRES